MQTVNQQDLTNAGYEFILVLNATSFLSMFKAADGSNDHIPAEKDSSPLSTRNTCLDE